MCGVHTRRIPRQGREELCQARHKPGFGFRFETLGLVVWVSGVEFGSRVWDLGFRGWVVGLWVRGSGVDGVGFRV